jgi:flagellar biosynthesis/type III secretory pathway protein FliH
VYLTKEAFEAPPDEDAFLEETDLVEKQDDLESEAHLQAAYDELVAAAQEEVAMLLQDARDNASAIVSRAETSAKELKAAAAEEGYGEGLAHAQDEVKDLFTRAQADIDATLETAVRERDNMIAQMEPKLYKVAIDIAEKILGYELENNENAYLSILKSALGNVKAENHVTLRVNPSEYVRFFKSREVTLHTAAGSITAEVVNDPTVGYGGCLIETESGAIDAGVDTQLEQMSNHLGIPREKAENDKQSCW